MHDSIPDGAFEKGELNRSPFKGREEGSGGVERETNNQEQE